MTPTTAKPRPTTWANCGGRGSSSSVGGLVRMRFQMAAYGDRPAAPSAKTTACRASRVALWVMSTAARTTVVIHAANRGALASINVGSFMEVPLTDGWRAWGQVRGPDTGSRRRGRSPPRASSPGPTCGSSYGVLEGGEDVLFAGLAGGALRDPALSVQDERRRGLEDVQPAHQLEVALRVHFDMPYAGDGGRDVAQDPLGRPAGSAEGARELQQRRPLTGRLPELAERGQQADGRVPRARVPQPPL